MDEFTDVELLIILWFRRMLYTVVRLSPPTNVNTLKKSANSYFLLQKAADHTKSLLLSL